MITYKQLSLADIFTNCQNKFDNDKYEFLSILEHNLNLDEIFPASFASHFHALPADPVSIFYILCSGLCFYNLYSQFLPHLF